MKLVFMGTPRAAVTSLERILSDGHEIKAVYTQPDRPSGRGNKTTFSPVKEFALANSLSLFQPSKIKTPEALAVFNSHGADAAVVVAYGRILPDGFLDAYPYGAINVHFSLLPKYRGAAPVNWAIVNGETETGVTTMRMDAGLDTGDIYLQRSIQIGREENSIELMERLAVTGANLLSETLRSLNTLSPKPQDNTAATLAPLMKKEDGLVEFSITAEEINNRVRGFQPFPTAHLFYQGKKLTLWRTRIAELPTTVVHKTGQILDAHADILSIACGGNSVLQIDELQLEGKRRMSTRDFLNGIKLQIGGVFG